MPSSGLQLKRIHYGVFILIGATLFNLSSHGLGRFAYAVILPSMREGLALDYTQTGLLATANFLGYLVFSLIIGVFAGRLGLRRLELIGLSLIAGSMAFTGLADSFLTAALGRTVTGVGSAIANVGTLGLAAAWFAPSRRGVATGIIIGGSGLGITLSGVLVPALVAADGDAGWRQAWFALGGWVFLVVALAYLVVRERPSQMGLLPVGAAPPQTGPRRAETAVEESQVQRPNWRLAYTSPDLWRCGVAYLAFGLAYVVAATFFAAYLTSEVGLTTIEAGRLWSTAGFISIFSPAAMGAISDSIGRARGLAVAFLLMALSLTVFATARSPQGAIVATVLFGLSVWPIPALFAAMASDLAGPQLAPAAIGFVTVLFGIGQTIGPGLGGYVADTTHSFAPALAASALVAYAGAAFSLTLARRPAAPPSASPPGSSLAGRGEPLST